MSNYAVNAGIPKTLVRHLVSFISDDKRPETSSPASGGHSGSPVSRSCCLPFRGKTYQRLRTWWGPYEFMPTFPVLYHPLGSNGRCRVGDRLCQIIPQSCWRRDFTAASSPSSSSAAVWPTALQGSGPGNFSPGGDVGDAQMTRWQHWWQEEPGGAGLSKNHPPPAAANFSPRKIEEFAGKGGARERTAFRRRRKQRQADFAPTRRMPSDAVAALRQEEPEGLDEAKTIPRQPPTGAPQNRRVCGGAERVTFVYCLIKRGGAGYDGSLPFPPTSPRPHT